MVGVQGVLFLFIYVWLPWVFAAARAFSSCSKQGLLSIAARGPCASHCGGFSCCEAQTLGTQASVDVVHRLSCPRALGIFPNWASDRTRVPCMPGGFLTAGLPGKSSDRFFNPVRYHVGLVLTKDLARPGLDLF